VWRVLQNRRKPPRQDKCPIEASVFPRGQL
jgi:hypothetical protein